MGIHDVLQTIFQIVIIPLLTTLTGFAVKWLNSKANEIKAKTDDAYLQKYITRLNDTITTTVIAVNQTYVDELKDQDIFTKEVQQEAFRRVYEVVQNSLNAEIYAYLDEAVGDLETYIKNKIEEAVHLNKA